jgi:hypothetical protein
MTGGALLRPLARPLAQRWRLADARLRSLAVQPHPDPVIVLGCQKAGTTAIAALLARHLDLPATLDMPALVGRVGRLDAEPALLGAFVRRFGWYFSRPVIKESWLTFAQAELRRLFPTAAMVLVVRDPRDNIRSILDRLDLPGDREDMAEDLEYLPAGWRELFGAARRPGGAGLHYIDALADRWCRAAEIAGRAADDPRLVMLRYEDFMADRAGSVAALADRLGRLGRRDIAGEVVRDFQPRGRSRGVPWLTVFGAGNLARIERRCAAGMARLGYAPAAAPSAPAD